MADAAEPAVRDVLQVILEAEQRRLVAANDRDEVLAQLGDQVVQLRATRGADINTALGSRFVIVREGLAELALGDLAAGKVISVVALGARRRDEPLLGLALSHSPRRAYFFPLRGGDAGRGFAPADLLPQIGALLEGKCICAHTSKQVYKVLRRHGITVNVGFDVQIAAILAGDGDHRSTGLVDLAKRILGVSKYEPDLETADIGRLPPREAHHAALRDCITVEQLREHYAPIMERDCGTVFGQVELPLVPVLAEIEMAGLPIDREYLAALRIEVTERLAKLKPQLDSLAGGTWDGSVVRLLYETLGLPVIERARKGPGQPATDEVTLTRLEQLVRPELATDDEVRRVRERQHLGVTLVMQHKKLATVRQCLNFEVDQATGRFYPDYAQIGTVTGRMSGDGVFHPLLIPKDETVPLSVAQVICGVPGRVVIRADMKAQEPTIAASWSGDHRMKKALASGNFHGLTARRAFGLKVASTEVKQRFPKEYAAGKALGMGLLNGETAFGIAADLSAVLGREVTHDEAQAFIDTFFHLYPELGTALEAAVEQARQHGFVTDMVCRRRPFQLLGQEIDPEADSDDWWAQRAEERAARNFPIQATASAVTKRAVVRAAALLRQRKLHGQIIGSVHDDIVVLAPADEIDATAAVLAEAIGCDDLLTQLGLDLPMVAEITVGPHWGSAGRVPWVPPGGDATPIVCEARTDGGDPDPVALASEPTPAGVGAGASEWLNLDGPVEAAARTACDAADAKERLRLDASTVAPHCAPSPEDSTASAAGPVEGVVTHSEAGPAAKRREKSPGQPAGKRKRKGAPKRRRRTRRKGRRSEHRPGKFAFWPTPMPVTRELLVQHPPTGLTLILEPSAGDGAIVRVLLAAGYEVAAIERRRRCRQVLRALTAHVRIGDFLKVNVESFLATAGVVRDANGVLPIGIIANVPFNPAKTMLAHVERIISLGVQYTALLLPATFRHSKQRAKFNRAHPPNGIYHLELRPSCSRDGRKGFRDLTWFVWDRSWGDRQRDITIQWDEDTAADEACMPASTVEEGPPGLTPASATAGSSTPSTPLPRKGEPRE
ncbi:MAG: hypothetical protein HY906_04725 [Deltaproteobacteria bacterium]|nr:hypothetical protein [Deltaproteobacteria bacterium]